MGGVVNAIEIYEHIPAYSCMQDKGTIRHSEHFLIICGVEFCAIIVNNEE
jgi:hypothetical protein